MRRDIVSFQLQRFFSKYARFVVSRPWPFLLLPLVCAIALTLGLLRMRNVDDIEYLYIPADAKGLAERKLVEELFPVDDFDRFTPLRMTRAEGFLEVLFEPEIGDNILTNDSIEEILALDDVIRSIEVIFNDDVIVFGNICSAWKGSCIDNDLVSLLRSGKLTPDSLTYPIANTDTTTVTLTSQLGGITLSPSTNHVLTAASIKLAYYVRYTSPNDVIVSETWLDKTLDHLLSYTSQHVRVCARTSMSFEQEFERSVYEVIDLFFITFTVISIFAVLSVFAIDMVRSKPLVAAGKNKKYKTTQIA